MFLVTASERSLHARWVACLQRSLTIKIVCAWDNLYQDDRRLSSSTLSVVALSRMFSRAHHEVIGPAWTRTVTIRRNSERPLAQVTSVRRAGSESSVGVTRMSLFEPRANLFNHNVRDRTDRAAADRLSWPRI